MNKEMSLVNKEFRLAIFVLFTVENRSVTIYKRYYILLYRKKAIIRCLVQ